MYRNLGAVDSPKAPVFRLMRELMLIRSELNSEIFSTDDTRHEEHWHFWHSSFSEGSL